MQLQKVLIDELKSMHEIGSSVSDMLARIKEKESEENIKMKSIMYFRAAFDLSISEVSAIPGWEGFGGELSSDRINRLVVIKRQGQGS
ncbi:hypothetical protein O5O45_08355 [Hahella aquimaris]|uniref:hypothetical protein n=1 Tax=Hahella sp. HNIBRBA332 TaxID=3015983 RepID=UPI00273C840A|nr:hypothetical protein [Hahella sp. HNIBRBA332]WLQ15925.1 hypothetical protein O5O45_08355 [Hahella sp. HNIBRBA332]